MRRFVGDDRNGRRTVLVLPIYLLSIVLASNSSPLDATDRDSSGLPCTGGTAKELRRACDSFPAQSIVERPENGRDHGNDERRETTNGSDVASTGDRGPRTRVPLCCPVAKRFQNSSCIPTGVDTSRFQFPPLYDANGFTLINRAPVLRNLDAFVRDPCIGQPRFKLGKEYNETVKLLSNGSVYYQRDDDTNIFTDRDYCFAVFRIEEYEVFFCDSETEDGSSSVAFPVGMIVSVPFLFVTFLVYTIVLELDNMHGRTLRGYIGPLQVAYVILSIVQITPQNRISDSVCIGLAFVIHFSFLASFFWLNVMCFDIWWTFGGFRSLQGSVKQRERKKFLIYSIYAWGCPSLLTGVCILMDSLRNVPEKFKPQFGVTSCWFSTETAKAIYFYGPMGLTVLCNVCLFVSTALKIVRHKKDTAHQLKGVDSRRHDDNKQWFNLYLKLFIVMGINWSMEIISWLCKDTPTYIWYLTDLANTLQGVIIFLIFVWKDKIRRLLLKRLGCHGRNFLSRTSTRSAYHSSASRTCTTSAVHLQEKVNPHTSEHSSSRGKPVFAESAAT